MHGSVPSTCQVHESGPRRTLVRMRETPAEPLGVRDALLDGLAGPGSSAPRRLAEAMTATISRPAHADEGSPRGAMLDSGRSPGPWLGYLLRPGGAGCWLALGWRPSNAAEAVRRALPLEFDGHFRLGPIDAKPERLSAVVLWVAYEADALPPEHRLRNDLHAMVMLHDLLAEPAPPAR
jgi:hypothetical protein